MLTLTRPSMALDPTTKLAQVREAMARADWAAAIRLASKFHTLGEHQEAIRRANDALHNPQIYVELGYDLETVMQEGIAALKDRFSRSWQAIADPPGHTSKQETDQDD